jgi:hypothetical protein
MPDRAIIEALKAENARLIALLESHGIDWRLPPPDLLVEPQLREELIDLGRTPRFVEDVGYAPAWLSCHGRSGCRGHR